VETESKKKSILSSTSIRRQAGGKKKNHIVVLWNNGEAVMGEENQTKHVTESYEDLFSHLRSVT
jgi:hypothetical protein